MTTTDTLKGGVVSMALTVASTFMGGMLSSPTLNTVAKV
jgi:hypothetical protein